MRSPLTRLPRNAYRFKGGSAPAPVYVQQPAAPAPTPPPAPTPLPTPAPAAPPATTTSLELTQAKNDAKRSAKARKGLPSTILAENATDPLGGSGGAANTVLGGG